jgi:hypothetical protein
MVKVKQVLAYQETRMTASTAESSAPAVLFAPSVCCAAGVLLTISVILMSRLVAARTALKSQVPRVLNLISTVLLAGGIAVSGWATSGQSYSNISSFSNVFLVFFGTVLLLRLLPLVYYSVLGRLETLRDLTNGAYYMADMLLVYFLNGLRFVLSLFDILTGLQAQLLFNTAYARQVGACWSAQLAVAAVRQLNGRLILAFIHVGSNSTCWCGVDGLDVWHSVVACLAHLFFLYGCCR